MEKYFIIYLAFISLVAVVYTIVDKKRATKSRRRISEKRLFAIAILGGSVAMYFTMKAVHHKTKKRRFMVGLPLIFMLQVAVLFLIFRFGDALLLPLLDM